MTCIIPALENETTQIKGLLSEIKKNCDDFDKRSRDENEIKPFIEKQLKAYSSKIDEHFIRVLTIIKDLSKEEYAAQQKYYQRELVPFFEISPYNKRVYEKPFGYPGDFIMMLYLYDNGYEGDTAFAKFIHRYSMNVPTAKANHNRRHFYRSQIEDLVNTVEAPHITSIACGPAIEIIEALNNTRGADSAFFTCLDFERRALDHVQREVKKISETKKIECRVKLVNADIRDLLKFEKIDGLFEDQDLIYSSGLIDYFSDKISSKMIEMLFKKLKKGGALIVGNVSKEDKSMAYTEFLGEWVLNRRSEDEMLRLADKITEKKEMRIEKEQETGMNLFMKITKTS